MAGSVRIRPYDAAVDQQMVLGWFDDPWFFFGGVKAPRLLTRDEAADILADKPHWFYILERGGEAVALARFGLDALRHRSAGFEVCPAPAARRQPERVLAAARLAVAAAFDELPVRRLLKFLLAFDRFGGWLYRALGFRDLGRRPEVVFAAGRYWDAIPCALDRGGGGRRPAWRQEPDGEPPPGRLVPDGFVPAGADGLAVRAPRPGDEGLLRAAERGHSALVAPLHLYRDAWGDAPGRPAAPLWAPFAEGVPDGRARQFVFDDGDRAVGALTLCDQDRVRQRARIAVWSNEAPPAAMLAAACDYCFRWANLHRVWGLLWADDDAGAAAATAAGFAREGTLRRAAFAAGRTRDLAVFSRLRAGEGAPAGGDVAPGPAASPAAGEPPSPAAYVLRPIDAPDLEAARALFDDPSFTFMTARPRLLPWAALNGLLCGGDRFGFWTDGGADGPADGRLVGLAAVARCPTFPSAEVWLRFSAAVPPADQVAQAARFFALLQDHYNLTRIQAPAWGFDPMGRGLLSRAGLALEATLRDHVFWRGSWRDVEVFSLLAPRVPGEE